MRITFCFALLCFAFESVYNIMAGQPGGYSNAYGLGGGSETPPIQPQVPRQKVLILDLNGLLLRLCKGVAEAERAKEFGHLLVSPVGSRMVYVPRVGVSSFLAEVATDFTLIIWTSRTSRNTHLLLKDMEERGFMPSRVFQRYSCK
ncbi:hypothetical protein R1flu_014354 [Riccia fluitans]|uniref:FCP1 homology domain-containing protein n=1 Tax=Riccia fluitans TaxID=41844 RepID=A0ABD1YG34_9MARC